MSRRGIRSGFRSFWRAAALGGVISAFMAFGPVIPAMVAGPAAPEPATACNAMIIDATAGHVLHDESAVTQAAAKLEAKGADVRIRVFDTAPDGSLDAYEAAQLAACPSWSLQGGIKPSLLVFLVSLDHKDAIFYGANNSGMRGRVDQIRADMGGDFRSGNFAAGIAKGEQETYSALYSSGTPWPWQAWLEIAGFFGLFGFAVVRTRRRTGYFFGGGDGGWFSSDGGGSGGGDSGGNSGSW